MSGKSEGRKNLAMSAPFVWSRGWVGEKVSESEREREGEGEGERGRGRGRGRDDRERHTHIYIYMYTYLSYWSSDDQKL